ncbi:hypothetical protein BGZ83_008021 [Gryganskiella cystojenkinii]|nr:hypothetical protein BGZ83_008021 [Gryganskiella cystojenkinii]
MPLLQRKSDRILAEIEAADAPLAPDVGAARSEQCQQALDLRRSVRETSERLKVALEHVEDIEDEDEPRILREPMEELQKLVREGLTVTSDPEARALLQNNSRKASRSLSPATATGFDTPGSLPIPRVASPNAGPGLGSGYIRPGTPPLGSIPRHPLGLFSTSPKFTAQSPFTSPALVSASRLSIIANPTTCDDPLSPPLAAYTSGQPTGSSNTKASIKKPAVISALTPVADDPLSIAPTITSPAKTTAKSSNYPLDSETTSSSRSSAASFSTPITSPVDGSLSPPTRSNTPRAKQSMENERTASPRTGTLPSPPQQRRVPRGLFSPSSVLQQGEDERRSGVHTEGPTLWPETSVNKHDAYVTSNSETPSSQGRIEILEDSLVIRDTTTSPKPQVPMSTTSSSQSPMSSEPQSPTSPKLQRTQAKPTPIQTASPASHNGSKKSRSHPDESGEEISQLARDLERAMNPTPTEPVPQPYFLQGTGLLQRIPSQVSMDDGLLNEERDGQISEESEDMYDQSNDHDGSGLQRGGGSLRRQRSGSRRRFRFARSRSRNRSKTRAESSRNSKAAVTPIDIGYSSTLTTSAWPFDQSPPEMLSIGALEQQRRQSRSRSRSRHRSSPPQPQRDEEGQIQRQTTTTGPHLPFADSVTIGNPIRIGRGIGSFTVYTVALTLCDPNKSADPREATGISGNDARTTLGQQQKLQTSNGTSNSSSSSSASPSTGARAGHVLDPLGVERSVPKLPSMASLMMTRSLSFPGLGPSAERLLMDIQPLPDNGLSSSSSSSPGAVTTAATSTSAHDRSRYNTGGTPSAPLKRVIQVRKRYSDFVTLRAQLVEMFKDKRRSRTGRNNRRLLSASTSSVVPPSRSTASQHPPRTQSLGAYYDVGFSDEEVNQEDDNDDDNADVNESNTTYGRQQSSTGVSINPAAQSSIIRGLPKLPPKKVVGKFRPAFVEKRRRELEYFLEWVVAHPVMGDCPVVVHWFLGSP